MIFLRMFTGYLVQMLPFAFLALCPFQNHLRISRRKMILLAAVLLTGAASFFAGACCCFQRYLPQSVQFMAANVVFMLNLLACALTYFMVVQAQWNKKLFVFTFCSTSACTITSAANALSTTLVSLSWDGQRLLVDASQIGELDGLPYQSWSLPVLAVVTAAAFPFLLQLVRHCYQPMADGISLKEDVYLSLLSLLLFVVLSGGLSVAYYDHLYNPLSLFLFIVLHISVFVIYMIIFKVIVLSREKAVAQQDADQARHSLSLQAEQYRRISEGIANSRRMRHDLRHHMVALQGFLQGDAVEQAKKYVDDYMEYAARHDPVSLCGNNVVNAVASYYQSPAAERGITFTAQVAVPEKFSVSDADISVLLGNLLENAIEAAECAEEEYRYIRLNMACSGKMLAGTVDNGFNGAVKMDGGRYSSTKARHNGIGMQSVERIAGKYHGVAAFRHEGQVFHFSGMLQI